MEIDTKLITKVKVAKSLGVIIDEHLSWSNHIGELSKKISSAIGALKLIRPYISKCTAIKIYQPLISPHFVTLRYKAVRGFIPPSRIWTSHHSFFFFFKVKTVYRGRVRFWIRETDRYHKAQIFEKKTSIS